MCLMFPVAVFTVLGQKGVRDSARGIVGVQLQAYKAGKKGCLKPTTLLS